MDWATDCGEPLGAGDGLGDGLPVGLGDGLLVGLGDELALAAGAAAAAATLSAPAAASTVSLFRFRVMIRRSRDKVTLRSTCFAPYGPGPSEGYGTQLGSGARVRAPGRGARLASEQDADDHPPCRMTRTRFDRMGSDIDHTQQITMPL
jgi:hypothetical protein